VSDPVRPPLGPPQSTTRLEPIGDKRACLCQESAETRHGDGFITGDQENIAVIQMVLGNSAPQPPPPGSGLYGPGCVK